jgi:putative membrane protein
MVLAQMYEGDHMDHGWWWAMGITWLVVAAVVVVLVVVLVRHFGNGPAGRRSAEDALDGRYARGEIDDDEYRRRRDTLRS